MIPPILAYTTDMRRVTVRGVIVKEDELFCVRLNSYRDNNPMDFWCTPGGGVDDGEELLTALKREFIEELGIEPAIGNLLYVQQYLESSGDEQMEFFFHVINTDDFLNIDLSKTTHGEKEIAELGFLDPKNIKVLPKFLATEPLDNLANQPTKFFSYL
jgi:8-oxo-dGTP diphosphatase